MPQPLYLPDHLVTQPERLPTTCQRHGRDAVASRRVTFYSRAPLWLLPILLVTGFLIPLIIYSVIRKSLVAPTWRVCESCRRVRHMGYASYGVVVAMCVVLTPLLARTLDGSAVVLTWGAGLVVMLVAAVWTSWDSIAAAHVTRDGRALKLQRATADYATLLPAQHSRP